MEILNTIIAILISLCVILLIVGVPMGIVFFALSFDKKDLSEKKKNRWMALIAILLPICLMFLLLSVWGLIAIISNTYSI